MFPEGKGMPGADGPSASPIARPTRQRHTALSLARGAVSVVVVVAIFALIIPKIASYRDVWATLQDLRSVELAAVVAAMVFNLFTYWWQMQAAMPGLTLAQAAVNNQTGTTIANVVPGGGIVAIGIVVQMFRSWGFTGSEIALELSTTGVWNSFLKLGLPIVALALLAVTGKATAALLIPALVGLAILLTAIIVFALMLQKKEFARAVGSTLGRAWSRVRTLVGKSPVTTWADAAVRFRRDTITLVADRWLPLTAATIASHLALFFVLLLALRFVGVSGHEVTWVQAFAVFAFARLLSAAPITPGGVGFVELALIAGLYAAGRHHVDAPLAAFKAQVTAAALLFRLLTYGVQIPIGGVTYLVWRRNRSWRREGTPITTG